MSDPTSRTWPSVSGTGEDAPPTRLAATKATPSTDDRPHTSTIPLPDDPDPPHLAHLPAPGETFHDFELVAVLGTGSFAKVYLARQMSLGRLVALKVSANRGNEARTLASLEHHNIVQVFSEAIDEVRGLRLLCMQYVAGTTLERVIRTLATWDRTAWSGRGVLEAIDALSTREVAFDPAALRDREFLDGCDHVEATCWIVGRVAEALAHAHGLKVLHRDIKPANILLTRYGRPLLADFNVAGPAHKDADNPSMFGGTLGYMAPEHLDAFNPDDPTLREVVDERSDIYSLGVVLFEMLTGRLPFPNIPAASRPADVLKAMAAERRASVPSPRDLADVPEALNRVVRHCLDPDPARRFQTATDMGRAVDGCRELRRVRRALPPAGPLTRCLLGWPFVFAWVLILLPHLLGSAVNIPYNTVRIVQNLTAEQRTAFYSTVLIYNLAAYPLGIVLMASVLLPIQRVWRRLDRGEPVSDAELDETRRRALRLPLWAVLLSLVAWVPGGVLFPLLVHLQAGPLGHEVFAHFLASFLISGLISLTYSVLSVQYLVVRVLYPRLETGAMGPGVAREELASVGRWLRLLQVLAVLIPLAGAVLLVAAGPEDFTPATYQTFRVLVSGLILLGMGGLVATIAVAALIDRTLAAWLTSNIHHKGTKDTK